jgi:hypothetical protein
LQECDHLGFQVLLTEMVLLGIKEDTDGDLKDREKPQNSDEEFAEQ